MDAQWWVVLVVVVIIVAVIVYLRSLRARDRSEQERRIDVQHQGGAQSAAEDVSQREDRRLAGMTTADREWEQASLQRNRDTQARTRKTEGRDDR